MGVFMVVRKQATASFAAASIFATNVTLGGVATGETRKSWIHYNSATVNTLRMSDDDGSVVASHQVLRADGDGTTNITASHLTVYHLFLEGGHNYSFSQSTGGTVTVFAIYAEE